MFCLTILEINNGPEAVNEKFYLYTVMSRQNLSLITLSYIRLAFVGWNQEMGKVRNPIEVNFKEDYLKFETFLSNIIETF